MKEAGSPNPMQRSYCLLSTGLGTEDVETTQWIPTHGYM